MTNYFAFLIAFFIPFFIASAAEIQPPRQVSVTGVCNRLVSPDRGSIVLTVEYLYPELSKATRQAAESYEKLVNDIKKLKLENLNLKTSEYTVYENKVWEKDREVSKGFIARIGLWVSTSDIQKLGDVIALASKEKVKNAGSLETYLSDEKQLAEEQACLVDATKNAKSKAEKLASSLGAKLGNVLTINESGRSFPRPRPMMDAMMSKRTALEAAPSIEAGQDNLSLNIHVSFELK